MYIVYLKQILIFNKYSLTEKNHWSSIVICVITVIPREITTHDGLHACSYCNTNTTIGKFS